MLIVEDEALIAMALKADLEDLGYEVTGIAMAAGEAVDLARQTRPDVVLMDMRLRGAGDGVEAALRIRAEEICAKVIFVTGSREPAVLRRIEADHPSAVLIKPVSPEEVNQVIRACL